MRFEKRVAVVTGGAAGIGRAACLAFAREGASVAVIDLKGAAVILFLASDAARYLHGAIVDVNGGIL